MRQLLKEKKKCAEKTSKTILQSEYKHAIDTCMKLDSETCLSTLEFVKKKNKVNKKT